MSPVPHIGRTITQRRTIPTVAEHPSVRAYQQNQRARIESIVSQLEPIPAEFVAVNDDAPKVPSVADLILVFGEAVIRTALFLAGWFVFGVGGASLYFLIRGWLA